MRHVMTGVLAGLVAVAGLACSPSGDVDDIKEQQEQILEKLAALEQGQKQLLAARPAARAGPPPEDFDKVYEIDIGDSPILGNPNAPVTLVEYSDFECPYCARAAPAVKAIYEKYPDKVRVVYKHFPLAFHRSARPAAIASVAAQEQGRFWEFHDVIFDSTSKRQLDASKLDEYAEAAGLDVAQFNKDMEANRAAYDKRVSQEYKAGQQIAVRGTPTLYINGKKVRDRSVDGMSKMVEAALEEQKKGS